MEVANFTREYFDPVKTLVFLISAFPASFTVSFVFGAIFAAGEGLNFLIVFLNFVNEPFNHDV